MITAQGKIHFLYWLSTFLTQPYICCCWVAVSSVAPSSLFTIPWSASLSFLSAFSYSIHLSPLYINIFVIFCQNMKCFYNENKCLLLLLFPFLQIHFKVDDVKVPEVPGMFTSFLVKNQPLFVDPRMFKELEHYGRLMGYDKPIDFHLGEEEQKWHNKMTLYVYTIIQCLFMHFEENRILLMYKMVWSKVWNGNIEYICNLKYT